ncbi:YceI family protein [Lacibacter sp. MH-610]|uniref:YceI family protein n=1 Tax=Lacibacter sp. MH-610 TaxID=3020883 RepID=UPI0038928C74
MSIKFIIRPLLVILIFTFQYLQAQTYSATTYKLSIKGTSTMHDWSSAATNVTVQGDFVINNGIIEKVTGGNVNVVTKSIKSDKNSGLMDSRTHETLKADKNPNITYAVTKVTGVPASGGEASVTVSGNLNIGGTSKPTDLTLKMKVLPNGDIEIKGTKKILMSNHGIKPPSFMLGALKVGDEVTLDIYVVLHKK